MKATSGILWTILVLTTPVVLADPAPGGDAGNSALTATPISAGTYSGSLTSGDEDWYEIAVPMLTRVLVTVNGCDGAYTVQLLQGNGQTVIMQGTCGDTLQCLSTFNQLVFARISGGTGNYSLTITPDAAVPGVPTWSTARLCTP